MKHPRGARVHVCVYTCVRVCAPLSNTRHKNVSTYKRRRLFHVITDFRPVNDFFESLTPPRSVAYYESLRARYLGLLPLNFTPRIGIDPSDRVLTRNRGRDAPACNESPGETQRRRRRRRIIVSQRFINRPTCNRSAIPRPIFLPGSLAAA